MKIKDYLLCFDSKEQAVAFGLGAGFVGFDENKQPYTTLATNTYAVAIIGPWVKQVGEDAEGQPITESDNKHWVLFRDLAGLPVPEGADRFIVWTSDEGERPKDAPQDDFAK